MAETFLQSAAFLTANIYDGSDVLIVTKGILQTALIWYAIGIRMADIAHEIRKVPQEFRKGWKGLEDHELPIFASLPAGPAKPQATLRSCLVITFGAVIGILVGVGLIALLGAPFPYFCPRQREVMIWSVLAGIVIATIFGRPKEPGTCPARLEPPDKPRPPAQVVLAPPKSNEDQRL
jgi:hypothetical protein